MNIKIGAHPLYRRDKADVLMDLPVTFAEAALGAQVVVPPRWHESALEGTCWCQDGTVLTVRGKGAPRLGKRSTGNGDLRVAIKIAVPEDVER